MKKEYDKLNRKEWYVMGLDNGVMLKVKNEKDYEKGLMVIAGSL